MANTSAIFKGSYTKLLTAFGLKLETGQHIAYVDGAALYATLVSDAGGVLTLQALPAAAVPSLDASKITTGVLDIARIPAAALERLVVVADQAARFALTTATVQLGDTVLQTDTNILYMVKDEANLANANGYQAYVAATAADVPNSVVLAKVLTGMVLADGAPVATDTILQAFGKLSRVPLTDASNQALIGEFNATSIVGAENELKTVFIDTKDPTGWVDPDSIGVTYDSAIRKVTLTHPSGFLVGYYQGKKFSIASPFLSAAHALTNGTYWLSVNSSGAYVWSAVNGANPGFDQVLVAYVNYGAISKFAFREVHGCSMDYKTHEECHRTIGAYRVSGSQITGSTYALNVNTVDAVTPGVDVGVIADEDLKTTIDALTNGSTYTRVHIDTGAAVFTTGSTFPFPDDGTNINYNQNPTTGTALTPMTTNNRWVNIYGLLASVDASVGSQAYRILWLTGQQIYTTAAAAQAEDFRTLILGNLSTLIPEMVPYIRLTYKRTTSSLTRNAQFDVNPSYLVGTALSLISVTGVTSPVAASIPNDTSAFTGNLTSLDINSQVEANTIDSIPISKGRNYLNAWNTCERPLGTIDTGISFANGQMRTQPTRWACTDVTKLTITQTAINPLDGLYSYSLSHAGVGAASVSTPLFTLGLIDVGTAQTVRFDISDVTTSGDYAVFLVRHNSSNVVQETITPALSTLPIGTSRFSTFFIAGSTATDKYALLFSRISATDTASPKIDELYIGPNVQVQGSVIGKWKSYTPSNFQGFGTPSGVAVQYREVGSNLEIRGKFVTGTVVASEAQIGLPTGFTTNTSELMVIGAGFSQNGSTTIFALSLLSDGAGKSYINMGEQNSISGGFAKKNGNAIFGSGEPLSLFCSVPVNELSSNVTLANRALEEYAYNTSGITTAGATNTTSFGYGPVGAAIGSIASTTAASNTIMRVRFLTPIQSTDVLTLEYALTTAPNNWMSFGTAGYNKTVGNTAVYGADITPIAGNTTDVDVRFGNMGSLGYAAAYGGAGQTWASASGLWRVRKTSGGASVGYPISSANIVGRTDGVAPAAGMVGEQITHTFAATAATASGNAFSVDNGSAWNLPAGVWSIEARGNMSFGGVTGNTYFVCDLNTSASVRASGYVCCSTASGTVTTALNIFPLKINASTSTRIYGVGQYDYSSKGSSTVAIEAIATRID